MTCVFPSVQIGQSPEITFEDFELLLEMNLSSADLKRVSFLKMFVDLKNLRAHWEKKPLDSRGNFNEKELDEALLIQDLMPGYVFDFLETYDSKELRLKNFSFLLVQYFNEAREQGGFLKKYLQFEREFSLILTSLRTKDLQRDLSVELQFEDPYDPLVSHILAQKDLDHYDPPMEYSSLKEIYLEYKTKPIELHRALLEYRMQKLLELEENREFSIDQVLICMVRLMIVEDWDRLDKDKGKQILESIA